MPTRDDLLSCYRILGLPPGSSLEAVRVAYKRLVRSWHPDRFMQDESMRRTAERQMKTINNAYETLSRFLSFRPPYRFEEPPPPARERPRARARGRESAVSRHRARTRAWWQSVRFSFTEAGSTSFASFVKTTSYGICAWILLLGAKAAFDALPNDVGLVLSMTAQLGVMAVVAFVWR